MFNQIYSWQLVVSFTVIQTDGQFYLIRSACVRINYNQMVWFFKSYVHRHAEELKFTMSLGSFRCIYLVKFQWRIGLLFCLRSELRALSELDALDSEWRRPATVAPLLQPLAARRRRIIQSCTVADLSRQISFSDNDCIHSVPSIHTTSDSSHS